MVSAYYGKRGEPVRVRIYTAPACVYCMRAKRLFSERGIPFEEVDVAQDAEQRAAMIEASGRRTVPQIVIDGRPIGGYEELAALDREGELRALLGEGPSSA
jgi:glutaredoxin 3